MLLMVSGSWYRLIMIIGTPAAPSDAPQLPTTFSKLASPLSTKLLSVTLSSCNTQTWTPTPFTTLNWHQAPVLLILKSLIIIQRANSWECKEKEMKIKIHRIRMIDLFPWVVESDSSMISLRWQMNLSNLCLDLSKIWCICKNEPYNWI